MMFHRIAYFAAGVVILLLTSAAQAQPRIEHIAPPVIEKGKVNRVTFVGKNLAGAIDVWSSLSAGALKAKPVESQHDKAVFDIETSSNAPVGVLGVRVATRDGLSNVHLFLIDDLPVKPKSTDETMTIGLPVAVWSTFREAEIDRYRIEVKAGQQVSFEVVGSRFGKDADPLVIIRDAHGKSVAERDNDPGLYYDCRFSHHFEQAGSYTVEVRDSRFRGNEHHQYVLRMGRFLAGRVVLPSAVRPGRNQLGLPEVPGALVSFDRESSLLPGPFFGALRRPDDEGSTWVPLTTTEGEITVAHSWDDKIASASEQAVSPATTLAFNLSPLRANPFLAIDKLIVGGRYQPTPAKVPGIFCGVLRKPGERQMFLFDLAKGQTIHVRGEAQALNSPVDLDMVMTERFGREIRRGTETRGETHFDFNSGNPGTFGLAVRDQLRDGGDAFTYRVTVSDKPFPPVLLAEVEGLTLPQGSAQPIPINVARTGTSGPIKLKLLGAPPGLKLTPDEIDEKSNSVVCKLAANAAVSVGVYTLQIRAETSSGPTLVRTQPMIDRQLINVDLIPLGLREDQRRIPPALADRFALQITPPAPFTMEIGEPVITLPRYQQADIPIVLTRQPGFDAAISFTAKGGQLADKKEGRTRVYAEFPHATVKDAKIVGSVHSKILSNTGKTLIEVSGITTFEGRKITLTRTFELNLVPAFTVTSEPTKISLLPGQSAPVRFSVSRVKSFAGAVKLNLSPMQGVEFPESVTIPSGRTSADVMIKIPEDSMPRQQNLQVMAMGTVDGFEEEQRPGAPTIEVRKVEAPKKDQSKK